MTVGKNKKGSEVEMTGKKAKKSAESKIRKSRAVTEEYETDYTDYETILDTVLRTAKELDVPDRLREEISNVVDLEKLEELVVEGGEVIQPGIETVQELVDTAKEIRGENIEIFSPSIQTAGEKI